MLLDLRSPASDPCCYSWVGILFTELLVPRAFGPLRFLLFPLHASVLEPDFNVALCEVQARRQLVSAWPGNVAVKQELLLQLQQLCPAVRCAASLLLVGVVAQKPAFRETEQRISFRSCNRCMNELDFLYMYQLQWPLKCALGQRATWSKKKKSTCTILSDFEMKCYFRSVELAPTVFSTCIEYYSTSSSLFNEVKCWRCAFLPGKTIKSYHLNAHCHMQISHFTL